jgi:hypothetical protein
MWWCRYGSATGYMLCSETTTECRFAATTSGSNCGALCTSLGGTCIDGDDNGAMPCVATTTADTCATNRTTTICVCSKP